MTVPFFLHLFTTFFMCGVCWFVQIVHYPLFKEIRKEDFPHYERKNFVTAYVTIPAMTIELFSGLWVLYSNFNTLFLINILLLGLIWGSTFIFQLPIHLKLSKTGLHKDIAFLIKTNWIRTIGWSIRSIILTYILVNSGNTTIF